MQRRSFGDLELCWDAGDLPFDPFEPVMPLPLDAAADQVAPRARITLRATLCTEPEPDPAAAGAEPVLYHGSTRCLREDSELVLFDSGSTLRISADGCEIQARVHPASIERPFHFSSATVVMTLLLAMRHHGYFHLHAAGAQWPDGDTWLIPAESGGGKSTLSLAAFAAGARWLGDDALLLREVDGEVRAYGWARRIRMTTQTADAFPSLGPMLTPCPAESARQWEMDPRRAFPGRGLPWAPGPFTLVLPRIVPQLHSEVAPLSQAEAFGRILHACAWVASEHLPRGRAHLDLLGRIVASSSLRDVGVGSRILSDPAGAIAELRSLLPPP